MIKEQLLHLDRLRWVQRVWGPRCLTVLAYHRIADPHQADFRTYRANVSATPANFAAQLDFLHKHFQPVSLAEVLAWLEEGRSLPRYPALVTFDDGYADNWSAAMPALRAHQTPAHIFLATAYIGQNRPFFWDLAAYCFHHTPLPEAELPGQGRVSWPDPQSKQSALENWLAWLKNLPDAAKWVALEQLPDQLHVTIPDNAFAGLHLTWDQVRQMAREGISFGAHTHTHPIMTRISLPQARHEANLSRARLQEELGQSVTTFAFPNGQATDFNTRLQDMLHQCGFRAAFTLLPGPNRARQARRAPFAIRRVAIHYRDALPRFAGKVMGLTRLINLPR